MKRTDFYNIIILADGTQEYDFLNTTISKFAMNYPVTYYRVQENELMRMDLISYKVYGTEDYWWLIAAVNGIDDIFNDLSVGMLLKIPNVQDIYEFYKKYRVT